MIGLEIIEKTKEYLDYLEEHLVNVRNAYDDVYKKCNHLKDIGFWADVYYAVKHHDLSKFSAEEFTQYREYFFHVNDCAIGPEAFKVAWEHHKVCNTHHWESLKTEVDVAHMVIDWTAMGYKFGDTAKTYYDKNKDSIEIPEDLKIFFKLVMGCIK